MTGELRSRATIATEATFVEQGVTSGRAVAENQWHRCSAWDRGTKNSIALTKETAFVTG